LGGRLPGDAGADDIVNGRNNVFQCLHTRVSSPAGYRAIEEAIRTTSRSGSGGLHACALMRSNSLRMVSSSAPWNRSFPAYDASVTLRPPSLIGGISPG